jgi:hypothetical protein
MPMQGMPYNLLKSNRVTGMGPQPIKASTSILGELWKWALIRLSYFGYRGKDCSIFQGFSWFSIFCARWVSCKLKKLL